MHHSQHRLHIALPGTFLALLFTTFTLAFVMPTSTSTPTPNSTIKTVLVFLAILTAIFTAAHYIVINPTPPNDMQHAELDRKDAIKLRRERGVRNEKRLEGFFGRGNERKLRKGGEEKNDAKAVKVAKARAERKREKEIRGALKREFWPTKGQMLGASREGTEEIRMDGEE